MDRGKLHSNVTFHCIIKGVERLPLLYKGQLNNKSNSSIKNLPRKEFILINNVVMMIKAYIPRKDVDPKNPPI